MKSLRSSGRSPVILLLIFSATLFSAVLSADDQRAATETDRIVVDPATTQFVLRRRLSADRVGVLDQAPSEGDQVKANSIVARLKDDVPLAAIAVATARAESDAEVLTAVKMAESERLEHQVMVDANSNSRSTTPTYTRTEIGRAQLRAEAADSQIAVKRHEKRLNELLLAQARSELKTFHIISPIDGVVTRVYRHAGEGVQQAEAILEVVNTSRIRVEGRVQAAMASRLRVGLPVVVRFEPGLAADASTDPQTAAKAMATEVGGVLGFVDVTAEGLGRERFIRVWAELENPGQVLRDGAPARMVISLKPQAAAVTSPAP